MEVLLLYETMVPAAKKKKAIEINLPPAYLFILLEKRMNQKKVILLVVLMCILKKQ